MNTRRERKSAQQWASIVEQFEQSKLSTDAFCEQHNLSTVTFNKWRRRAKLHSSNEPPAFKQVKTAVAQNDSPVRQPSIITLQVGHHVTLTIASESSSS